MRLTSLAVLALVSSLTLAGCGDDSGDVALKKDRATTTEAGDNGGDEGDDGGDAGSDPDREAFIESMLADDAPFDEEEAGCVADETLPDISDEGRETVLTDSSFDLTDLSDEDADTLMAALDECVSLERIAGEFTAATVSEFGVDLSDDELSCTADEIGSGYSGAGEFLREATEAEGAAGAELLFSALGECISDDTAIAIFSAATADTDIPPDTAECMATEIVGQIGASRMLELFLAAGSGDSSELESLSADAALACGAAGLEEGGDVPIPSIGGGLSGQ